MHPYRELVASDEAPKPPKSKLPLILVIAGALHAGVLGAGAFAHPATAAAGASVRSDGPSITVLGGHVDEATGNVAFSGYRTGSAPKSYAR
ncbi:hypothetical protein BH09MYX1_BH09MYX1_59900 [soil metagenome]